MEALHEQNKDFSTHKTEEIHLISPQEETSAKKSATLNLKSKPQRKVNLVQPTFSNEKKGPLNNWDVKIIAEQSQIDDEIEATPEEIFRWTADKDEHLAVLKDDPGEIIDLTTKKLYLRDVKKCPRITPQEEIELAQDIEAGAAAAKTLSDKNKTDNSSNNEDLDEAISKGELAKRRMTEANLLLVISVVGKYLNRGIAEEDLISEGNIGLMRAVDKFDWRRGFHFSTYAYWWIRQNISRAVADKSRTIRLPAHLVEILNKINTVTGKLEAEIGRAPTHEEIGNALGVPAKKVEEILKLSKIPVSLDATVTDNEDSIRWEEVKEDPTVNVESDGLNQVSATETDRLLQEKLSPREMELLRLRFGLEDGNERSLSEIGKEFGISRERVRQIEYTAMNKIRNDELLMNKLKASR